jgi:hypothetical protein
MKNIRASSLDEFTTMVNAVALARSITPMQVFFNYLRCVEFIESEFNKLISEPAATSGKEPDRSVKVTEDHRA